MQPRDDPQEVVIRGTDVGYEFQKLGYRLGMAAIALFLHPRFAFVGFYLACLFVVLGLVGVVVIAGEASGAEIEALPDWAVALVFAAPIPITYLLRNYVRTIMKWLLIALAVMLGIDLIVWMFS